MATRASVYVRVSTDEQAREGVSLEAQQQACVAFARSQGWSVSDVYIDDGYSAKNLDRPALQRLIGDVRAGRCDAVLAWKVDRVSRRLVDLLQLLHGELEPRGVAFRSATEAFDTSSPLGKATLQLLGVFAELERGHIIERTRLGHDAAVQRGRWGGRTPYGYRVGAGGLEPNPDTAPFVRVIFEMLAAGKGNIHVVEELNARGAPRNQGGRRWHPSVVRDIAHSRAYLGEVAWRGAWHPGAHEPLIPSELWEAAQASMATRHTRPSPRSLLGGLGRCALCGSPLRMHRVSRRYLYYQCRGREEQGNGCRLPSLAMDAVHALLWERVETLASDESALRSALQAQEGAGDRVAALREEDAALARAEAEAGRRRDLWIHAVERGEIGFADLRQRIAQLQEELGAAVARRREIAAQLSRVSVTRERLGDYGRLLRKYARVLHAMPLTEQRTVLRTMISAVEVGPGPALGRIVWR